MYAGDDVSWVVVDVGTDTTRLGYAGEDQPQSITYSKYGVIKDGSHRDGEIITNEARINFERKHFEVKSIVDSDGFVTDYDKYQVYLENKIKDYLHLNIDESPLMFTEPSEHNKEQRLKLTEILFEKWNIPCMFIWKNAVLSSFSSGKSTWLVLDSGHSNTFAAPVHEGYILHNSTLKYKIGGKFVSDRLIQHIRSKGAEVHPRYAFDKEYEGENFWVTLKDVSGFWDSYRDFHINKTIKLFKEECSLVSDVALSEKKIENIKHYEYELPDGNRFEIAGERCLYPEVFFWGFEAINDDLKKRGLDIDLGDDMGGLKGFIGMQHAITDSINQTDLDIRKELYSNILVTGGNSMTQGFLARLQKEVPDIAPQNLRVKVYSSHSGSLTEYSASSWVGGSILGSLGSFQQMWFSKQEYEENGAIMIERKCP